MGKDNDETRMIIKILRGRTSNDVIKVVSSKSASNIIRKAKRYLEPMEYHRFKYNLDNIINNKRADFNNQKKLNSLTMERMK